MLTHFQLKTYQLCRYRHNRHSCAMMMLQHGVDQATIALWLEHNSVETTYIYLHSDLKRKEQALAKTSSTGIPLHRYQPKDSVLAYLDSL